VLNPENLFTRLAKTSYKLLVLVNPNNPTSALVPLELIELAAKRHPETLIIVDETYIEFTGAGNSCERMVRSLPISSS